MSENKEKKSYEEAILIAEHVISLIKPHCVRVEIAGSLRRKCQYVGDIEIVLIAKPYEVGLFESGVAEIINQWQKVKGELNYGICKYTQRIHQSGIKIDFFFAQEDNWGNTLAIRTGSSDYSYKVLANGWKSAGYESENNYLYKIGDRTEKMVLKEEKDLFDLIGIEYIDPEKRNLN